MKRYMSIVCVKEKDKQDEVIGLEFRAKSQSKAESRAVELLSAARPKFESATWLCTSRLKQVEPFGKNYMPVNKSILDWATGVEEWISEGGDLVPISMPEADAAPVTVKPPKEVTPVKQTYKYGGNYSGTIVHPITEAVIQSARSISHYEYKSGERTEVFK